MALSRCSVRRAVRLATCTVALFLVAVLVPVDVASAQEERPSIDEKTAHMQKIDGFFSAVLG